MEKEQIEIAKLVGPIVPSPRGLAFAVGVVKLPSGQLAVCRFSTSMAGYPDLTGEIGSEIRVARGPFYPKYGEVSAAMTAPVLG